MSSSFRFRLCAAVLLGTAAVLTSCSSSSPATPPGTTDSDKGEIIVYAAASLSDVLPEIMDETVLRDHPDTEISYNFNGSSSLVDEIAAGAPADVLLTADESNMEKADLKSLISDAQIFTANTLTLVVPNSNPGSINNFTTNDLNGKRLVTCAPAVPCGRAAQELAALSDVRLNPVSEEQSVSDVIDKVVSGEADAGIVYKTDAMEKADSIDVIDIPRANEVVNNYMIATIKESKNKAGAQAVTDAILSEPGQEILKRYGFIDINSGLSGRSAS